MSTTPLTRLPDWQERLNAFVLARLRAPFGWGANDCVTFAADGVLAMTTIDPLAALRGRWSTEAQAQAVIDEVSGGAGLAAAAEVLLPAIGCTEVPVPYIQRGDIALWQHLGRATLGLCGGDRIHAPGPTRLASGPCSAALRVWR